MLAASALTLPSVVHAEEPTVLTPVVVTATRGAHHIKLDQIGGSASILTPEDLHDRQTRVVTDILRDIPGVSVSRSGAAGNFTQVRLRGGEANHVLMLIDGVEVSDPFMGEFDFATLLADDVARIDILRGAQSALYGSDALAGVINYITPSGREASGLSARIEGGSFGTYGLAARSGGYGDRWDAVVSASFQHSDGYATGTHGHRSIGSDIGSLSARGGVDVSSAIRIGGGLRWTRTEADTNGQDYATGWIIDTPGAFGVVDSLYADLALTYGPVDSRWRHDVSLQHVSADRDDYAQSGRTGGGEGTRSKASYTASGSYEAGVVDHQFTLAIDAERETFRNSAPEMTGGPDTTERSRQTLGVVGQYNLLADGWGGGLALRHDWNDGFADVWTYRGHAYRELGQLRLRASAGSGVKNPGQTEMYGYNASAYPFVGNPALKPETSVGWEVGGDWALGTDRQLSVTYFHARLKDEIYGVYNVDPALCALTRQPVPVSCSTSGNRDEMSKRQGIEAALSYRLNDMLRLQMAYTYLDATEDGQREIRRPAHIASANLNLRSRDGRKQVNATVRYNGENLDTDHSVYPSQTVTLSPFWLVNLSGSWALSERSEVFGRIENLLDEDYQEILNYRGAGRAAYVGVRVRY